MSVTSRSKPPVMAPDARRHHRVQPIAPPQLTLIQRWASNDKYHRASGRREFRQKFKSASINTTLAFIADKPSRVRTFAASCIWGYGRIGQLVAGYGRAFGMRVLIWGRAPSRERAVLDGYEVTSSREELFEQCDVLSLHLRLCEETTGVITTEDLSRMKPTALLVNISRAELIQPDALLGALNRGRPGMAAVDVYESEPILQGHALLRLENCICTPHIGYVELDSYEIHFGAAFENVVNSIKGRPTNIVDPGDLLVRR